MQSSETKQFTLQLSAEQAHCFQNASKNLRLSAYEDLGAEAIRKIEVEDFPVIVVVDSEGNNLYETAIKEFAVED